MQYVLEYLVSIYYFLKFYLDLEFTKEEQAEYDFLTAPVEHYSKRQQKKQYEKIPRYEQFCNKWQ